MRTPLILLSTIMLLITPVAKASLSLTQIQYALEKNPSADVERDLRTLSAAGYRDAKLALADLLAQRDVRHSREAIDLYQQAYAGGHGEILALTSLARLLDRQPRARRANSNYMRRALKHLRYEQDPTTVFSALEVFLTYPELFESGDIERLIALYRRSCLAYCRPDLYRAVLAQQQGDLDLAERLYRIAVWSDTRAVTRYYQFLGDRRDDAFPRFAESLEKHRDRLPVETVHRIATLLDTIYSTRAGLAAIDLAHARRAAQTLPDERRLDADDGLDQLQAEQARLQRSDQIRVRQWLEAAIARDWLPAMVSMVNNMTSSSLDFDSEQAFALIERIEQREPRQGRALRAAALMVTGWPSLDPFQAHDIIQALIAENYPPAWLLLGDLYSRGGLDEADIAQALRIYHEQADEGASAAYYRIANLLSNGRAICRDLPRASAYASAAQALGDARADGLLRRLDRMMTDEQRRSAVLRSEALLEQQLP